MNDIEEMKEMWSDLNNRLTALERENQMLAEQVSRNKFRSSKDKLVNKYRRFIILEVVLLIFCWLYFTESPFFIPGSRWILVGYWTLMFLVEIAIDVYLMEGVRDIDIVNDPVSVVAAKAHKYQKVHKLFICFGLPIAFIGVGIFIWAMGEYNYSMILGVCTGAAIGLIIGIRQYMDFMRAYKNLQ